MSSSDVSFHHRYSSTDEGVSFSYDGNGGDFLFYSDDVAQGNLNNNSLDPFSSSFFSFSSSRNGFNINGHGFGNFSSAASDESGVLECRRIGVEDYTYNSIQHFLLPHSSCNSGAAETENASSKLIQRSYSCSNYFDGRPAGFPFETDHRNCSNLNMDSPNFQWHSATSENSFFTGEMRRTCSAGDLQNMMKVTHSTLEEANLKVGRYSSEERKEKISKYRAKRSQRKFNKIIKYACRKTLADNRTRIRGRFARNDETSHIPKVPCSNTQQYEDQFWVEFIEGLNDELLD